MRLFAIALAFVWIQLPTASALSMKEPAQGRVHLASTFHYRPIRDVALKILAQYPPDQYHYVGIGRSPTPVIAMIQAILGVDAATNVPLSSLQDLQAPNVQILQNSRLPWYDSNLMRENARARLYNPENLVHLHAHLKDRLPSVDTREGAKRMLFIDFADTGSSLLNLKREVDRHELEMPVGQRRPYAFLALTHRLDGLMNLLLSNGIAVLELRGRALSLIDSILYKHLAEYGLWSPHNELSRKIKSRTRAVIRKEYRQSLLRTTWSGSKREGWARQGRRDMYQRYQQLEAYEDLRAAFAQRVAKDPLVGAAIGEGVKLTRLVRLKIVCEKLLDGVVDAFYQRRYDR